MPVQTGSVSVLSNNNFGGSVQSNNRCKHLISSRQSKSFLYVIVTNLTMTTIKIPAVLW